MAGEEEINSVTDIQNTEIDEEEYLAKLRELEESRKAVLDKIESLYDEILCSNIKDKPHFQEMLMKEKQERQKPETSNLRDVEQEAVPLQHIEGKSQMPSGIQRSSRKHKSCPHNGHRKHDEGANSNREVINPNKKNASGKNMHSHKNQYSNFHGILWNCTNNCNMECVYCILACMADNSSVSGSSNASSKEHRNSVIRDQYHRHKRSCEVDAFSKPAASKSSDAKPDHMYGSNKSSDSSSSSKSITKGKETRRTSQTRKNNSSRKHSFSNVSAREDSDDTIRSNQSDSSCKKMNGNCAERDSSVVQNEDSLISSVSGETEVAKRKSSITETHKSSQKSSSRSPSKHDYNTPNPASALEQTDHGTESEKTSHVSSILPDSPVSKGENSPVALNKSSSEKNRGAAEELLGQSQHLPLEDPLQNTVEVERQRSSKKSGDQDIQVDIAKRKISEAESGIHANDLPSETESTENQNNPGKKESRVASNGHRIPFLSENANKKTRKEFKVLSITIPQPFHLQLGGREKPWKDCTERIIHDIEKENAVERHQKLHANPIPGHTFLPLYQKMVEEREEREKLRKAKVAERHQTLSKPFTFVTDKRLLERRCASASSICQDTCDQSNQFKANPVSSKIIGPESQLRLNLEEELRKMRIKLRAKEVMKDSTLPFTSKDWKFKHCCNLQCKGSSNVSKPCNDRRMDSVKKASVLNDNTHNKSLYVQPFTLRTAMLPTRTTCHKHSEEVRPKPAHRVYRSYSAPPSPIKMTIAAKLKEKLIQDKMLADKRNAIKLAMEDKEQKARNRHLQKEFLWKTHGNLLQSQKAIQAKLRSLRQNALEREREYQKELDAMKERVRRRPLLIERQSMEAAKQLVDRKYRNKLQEVGLDMNYILEKSQKYLSFTPSNSEEEESHPSQVSEVNQTDEISGTRTYDVDEHSETEEAKELDDEQELENEEEEEDEGEQEIENGTDDQEQTESDEVQENEVDAGEEEQGDINNGQENNTDNDEHLESDDDQHSEEDQSERLSSHSEELELE